MEDLVCNECGYEWTLEPDEDGLLMVMVVHHALIVVLDVAFRQVIMVISNAILVVMSFVNMVMAGFI